MITKAIRNCLANAKERKWDKTYWAFDIHGTILRPTCQTGVISTEFYPFAKEVLQLLSTRKDIVRILYTCSYPNEIVEYVKYFEDHQIHFDHVNENPDVGAGAYGFYERKFYFNVLFEDKAGFDPLTDWEDVLKLIQTFEI
ncbi:hypothetical protein [Chryseolinea soli]|uniref:HAD family hydrolase n=1 Tax=Chryseolinea soli TaxID=2321403 RepID=A0A385SN93_9BACT|nr:hypothetical protein [Chryseolinea soli]AYB30920.1 hypothetical protein D4L85_10170 [Chryseolinea soli]